MRCSICWDEKPTEMQELNCKHSFCSQCLALCIGTLCPAVACESTRCNDVIVDEMAGMDDNGGAQISFGGHTVAVLDLEERQRCDARHGPFQCTNVARMHLVNCRHRICFDCLTGKIHQAVAAKETPHCPIEFCSNAISLTEIGNLAKRCPNVKQLCARAEPLIEPPPAEVAPTKDEVVVETSIYGREATTKRITLPKSCQIGDVVNAILQLQRLAKNRSTSSLGIFIRKEIDKGLYKYERVSPKELGRRAIRDLGWASEGTHLVVDLDNLLHRQKK